MLFVLNLKAFNRNLNILNICSVFWGLKACIHRDRLQTGSQNDISIMLSTKIRTNLIWWCGTPLSGRYLNIWHLLYSPLKKLAKVEKEMPIQERSKISYQLVCLYEFLLKSFTLHSSVAPQSSPPSWSFVNSQCAVCSRKKKGRLTLTQASMGRGEHLYLAGNPPPSSFVKGTHLKGLFELWAGVLFSISKKLELRQIPVPPVACSWSVNIYKRQLSSLGHCGTLKRALVDQIFFKLGIIFTTKWKRNGKCYSFRFFCCCKT